MPSPRFFPLLALCLLVLSASVAEAQVTQEVIGTFETGSSDWIRARQRGTEAPLADVRLISAVSATNNAREIRLGLHFKIEPGWKISWKNPGDAGGPPTVDWAGSENLDGMDWHWPLPKRFDFPGLTDSEPLQTFGYKGEVVIPLTAHLSDETKGLRLKGRLDYAICKKVCIYGSADLTFDLAPGPGAPTDLAHLIGQYMAQVPGDGAAHGLTLLETALEDGPEGAVVRVKVRAESPFAEPDLFVEGLSPAGAEKPEVTLSDNDRVVTLRAAVTRGLGESAKAVMADKVAGRPLTMTVADGKRGLEVTASPPTVAPMANAGSRLTLFAVLGLALIGGLILNLMPCVLPVLSLKVMGLVGHGGGEKKAVRLSFVVTSLGILFSFLLLAGAAVAVKQAGLAVGWGIQFQQPLFLIAMVVLLTLFAANLWGLFEIILPDWANPGGLFDRPDHSHSLGGHFMTGAFATVLATPCSAPFLGTAVGFALARGATEIFLIFAFLGLGMALPYLAVALFPGLATRLPRPGAWMVKVKGMLGLALALTAVWLLTVLVATVGVKGAGMVGGLMLAALALLAFKIKFRKGLVAAFTLLAFFTPLVSGGGTASDSGSWEPFDRGAIAALVAEGRVVFVDVTADWCITCQVNKEAVLKRGAVAERLKDPNLVAMRADWTKPSDAIADYLASFGRYGIPFNAVYGPGAPNGLPLSELLTEDEVVNALDKAEGK